MKFLANLTLANRERPVRRCPRRGDPRRRVVHQPQVRSVAAGHETTSGDEKHGTWM